MGYDFMVSNTIGALPHRATFVREDNERPTWLSTDHAPGLSQWPKGLTEDRDKLFFNDKLLVPENQVEALIDDWHNAQLMHPGRDKMQRDLEWRFEFPLGYYAI